jgi:hypothetical protein
MVKTLKSVTDGRVRAYIVWLPIFGGDFNGEARKLSNRFRDKRVSYYLDPDSETGKEWERVLKTDRPIAWDVYMLCAAETHWEDEPPQPTFWMHQLTGVTKAPQLDEAAFAAKLKAMVDELKAQPVKDRPSGRAKLDSLHGKSSSVADSR